MRTLLVEDGMGATLEFTRWPFAPAVLHAWVRRDSPGTTPWRRVTPDDWRRLGENAHDLRVELAKFTPGDCVPSDEFRRDARLSPSKSAGVPHGECRECCGTSGGQSSE